MELVTPADVEREMIELAHRMDKAPATIKEYHERLRIARQAHRKAYALAYSSAGGTQMDRRMQADLDTVETSAAMDEAEVAYRFVIDTFDGLRTKLRALQSVSSLMKAEMFQGGAG